MTIQNFTLAHQKLTDTEGKLCSEIQLFKPGRFIYKNGAPFEINDRVMDEMIDNWKSQCERSKDPEWLMIDYNHESLSGHVDNAKAAGWIEKIYKKEDGLYANVKWTEPAKQYIKNKEYKFISPEFSEDRRDEYGEIFKGASIAAVGLVNRPFLKGMKSVTLSEKHKEDLVMKEQVGKALGLSGEYGEKEIIKAIETNASGNKTLSDVRTALKLKEGEDPIAVIKQLSEKTEAQKTDIEKLTSDVKKLSEDGKLRDATAAVEKLLSEKKLTPKQRDSWIKLAVSNDEQFKLMAADLTVIPALEGPVGNPGDPKTSEVDELDQAVRKCMETEKCDYVTGLEKVKKTHPDLVKKHVASSN